MSTYTDPFGKERSSSITEYAPNEINRTTREKNIKTLQDIRKDHLRPNNLAADNVKDFLQDTNTSFSTDGGRITQDPQILEKRIMKQQYLINNKLFDPTEYFGGLDISNLDEHPVDQRLDDMFLYYLPTEAEEREVTNQPVVKQTQSDKPQSKPVNTPKPIEVSKSNWDTNAKDKASNKSDFYASIVKEFPETTKAGGKEAIEFEPLSPLSASNMKLHPNFKKEYGQSLLGKTKNPLKPKVIGQTSSVVQEYKPVIAHKKKKSAGLSDKENKAEDRDIAHLRSKKSASMSKKPGSVESKGNYRNISDMTASSFAPKSANTSITRNNRSTVQDGQNYSLNTTVKANTSQNNTKTDIERKPAVSDKTLTKEDPNQRIGSTKLDTQSTGRSKTKSTDQVQTSQNLRRLRKTRKNFSSFNSTLTTEDEPEFLFKSFNTLTRPQTSHTVAIDDNNYVLKGILSPTITKNLVSKGINSKAAKNTQKGADKPQPVNPLKFLNDLLSKRKISSGSTDHLRMPKKPTFLENRIGSPGAQIGPKHSKTPSKSDLFEARITNHVNKKVQGANAGNYASANFKSLFTLKNFEK